MAARPKHLKPSKHFPNLTKKSNNVTSDQDKQYNCIAYAAGRTDKKMWPTYHPDYYWPPQLERGPDDLSALIGLFESMGYARCSDGKWEEGFEKVAIYVIPSSGRATHAARQIGPDKWVSKLGEQYDIEHARDAVSGGLYGEMSVYLKRLSQKPRA